MRQIKFKIKNLPKAGGITLIEILLVIFMIALFSAILIPDFPKIKKKFALTRAVYKFAQDLKRAQDMGLSGVLSQNPLAKGYGVFIDFNNPALGNKKYIIYADMDGDSQYVSQNDSVLDTIDLAATEGGVIINNIYNVLGNQLVSINFAPPNPNVAIVDLIPDSAAAEIEFAIESDLSEARTVSVNTSGLIEVE